MFYSQLRSDVGGNMVPFAAVLVSSVYRRLSPWQATLLSFTFAASTVIHIRPLIYQCKREERVSFVRDPRGRTHVGVYLYTPA